MRDDPEPIPETPAAGSGWDPTSDVRPLVVAVDRAFRELFSAVDTALDGAAARMGINRTDLRCLEVLDRRGPLSAGALADAIGLSAAAVTKIVDRLVATGYVERVSDPSDRRRVVVRTTEREHQVRRGVFLPLVSDGMRLLDECSDEELRLLRAVLERSTALNRAHAGRLDDERSSPE
ncbi:MAG TPA: MarR family transcriptional regulator [Euzebyales bacterium]